MERERERERDREWERDLYSDSDPIVISEWLYVTARSWRRHWRGGGSGSADMLLRLRRPSICCHSHYVD